MAKKLLYIVQSMWLWVLFLSKEGKHTAVVAEGGEGIEPFKTKTKMSGPSAVPVLQIHC
jgi:hypothetical protein